MKILYIILAALASEVTFVLGFLIVYTIARIFILGFSFVLNLKNKYRWMLQGIFCGIGVIYLSCYVSFLITQNLNLSELEVMLVAIILPIIGEVGYFRYLVISKKAFFISRLHLAVKVFPQRMEFESNSHAVKAEMTSKKIDEDFENEDTLKTLQQEAYERTQGALFYLLIWSFLGYVFGLLVVHHFLF